MSGSGAGSALRAKLDLAAPVLRMAAARLWQASQPRERYASYLCVMHAVVRASVPLMEAAAERCATLPGSDPVAGPLRAYLCRHIEEERHHDRWLLADLVALGHDPREPLRRTPPASVARLVGAQYYWVLHHHPICLLGYIAVLEGYPPSPGLGRHLAARTGYPDPAFRTLRAHSLLDIAHAEAVFAVLETLPVSAAQQSALGLSALHTVACAAQVLDEIAAGEPAPQPIHGRSRT